MSNMCDAVGLCIPYGEASSPYQTEFEPALGAVWASFNPQGIACYSPALLKAMIEHDRRLIENGGRVDVDGEMQQVSYYITRSRTMPSCASTCSTRAAAASSARR